MKYQEEAGLTRDSVVNLSERRVIQSISRLQPIERHWDAARAGRIVPSRSDIDPRQMSSVLEHAFILERLATGLARFRLAGSHVNDLVGLEVRGMPLSSIFTPDGRRVLSDALQAVFDEPATVRLLLECPAEFGRPEITGEMILLPLRSDLGDVTRILGGLVMHGDVGRRPRRLSIGGQTRQTLTGYAKVASDTPVPVAVPAVEPRVSRGHLTLVVDNC